MQYQPPQQLGQSGSGWPQQQQNTGYPQWQEQPLSPFPPPPGTSPQYMTPQQPYPQNQPPKKSGNKRFWLWVAVALFVGMVIGYGIHTPANSPNSTTSTTQSDNQQTQSAPTQAAVTPTPTPIPPTPTPTHAPKWVTTHSFTGNGNVKTATFNVPGDWKMLWACPASDVANQMGEYNLAVDVNYSDGSPADPVAINELCQTGNLSGGTEERVSGSVYLDITSESGWTITIQELK